MDSQKQYIVLIEELLMPGADSHSSDLLSKLESIEDKTADINAIFNKDPRLLNEPTRWSEILRLLRYSVQQKMQLGQYYDIFVGAYTELGNIMQADEDQKKLKEELGMVMYNIDDATGNHERLAKKILQELSVNMMRLLPRVGNAENMYDSSIEASLQPRIHELTQEMTQIVAKFRTEHEICEALDRMRALILSNDSNQDPA